LTTSPNNFLIIDDDPTNNLLCEAALKKAFVGSDVISFIKPEDGIKYIETIYPLNPVPTILFLDINMPSLSGWDVLRKFKINLHKIAPDIAIYILSSSIDSADKQRAEENELVKGYIAKPLSRKNLITMFG
jgi:CheY-like chemotaxis protein